MPENIVSKKDEDNWNKAKQIAKDQGQENNYALIVSIYEKIKNKKQNSEDCLKEKEINISDEVKQLISFFDFSKKESLLFEKIEAINECLKEYNVFLIKKLFNYELSKELSLIESENNVVEKLPNGKKFLLKKINNKIETSPKVELSKEIIREVLNDPRDFIIESYVLKDGNKDILYACDAYYINEDISKLSCIERKKYLKTLGFAIKFRLNPFVIVEKNDLEKAIKLFSKARNSNGVIVRNPDSFENSIMVIKSG